MATTVKYDRYALTMPDRSIRSLADAQKVARATTITTSLAHSSLIHLTLMAMDTNWKKVVGGNNYILSEGTFYISYNPNTANDMMSRFFTQLANSSGRNVQDGEETALTDTIKDKWFILEGDFRKEYEEAFPKGLEACMEVYKKNIAKRSEWSND